MARVRSSSSLTPDSDVIQKVYDPKGVFLSTYKWASGGLIGESSTITDEVTPNYRRRRKNGDIILNPVSLVRNVTTHSSKGSITVGPHSSSWGKVTIDGDIGSVVESKVVGPYLGYDANHEQIAINRAYQSMNASPIMGGEILGTFGQTLSMLRHPFKSATSLLLRAEKRKNWYLARKSGTAIQASAQAWLETRYGWKPIIGDCRETMRQVSLLRRSADRSIRVARGGSRSEGSIAIDFLVTIFSDNYIAKGTKTLNQKVRASAGVLYRMKESSESERAAQAFGLNARSIPSTLWELTPYSFVVDWFVGVGPWIEAIVPRPDITVLGSWSTRVVEDSVILSGGPLTRTLPSPTKTYHGTWNGVSHKTTRYERSIGTSPSSTPKLLAKPLTISKTVDGLSLALGKITQSLRRLRH